MNKQHSVLVLDIETSLMTAYVFNTGEQYVGYSDIKDDWYIMAWGAKWAGDPDSKIIYKASYTGDDSKILKPLWDLLNEADIVLTQNGTKFDARKINARFMLNGFPPPKPYVHFDTFRLTKKVASFTSHSLEYLSSKFCTKHKKTSHAKYPGKKLWVECSAGNHDAQDEMKRYNIKDVLSTEELYLKIKAWAPESMPKVFDVTDNSLECSSCGYVGKMRVGKPRVSKSFSYVQHSCPECGHWQKAERINKGSGK